MQDQVQPKPSQLNRNLNRNTAVLPQIPDKIYFTIGEVSKLCLLEPYVLRYWEQEFPQLSPTKRCGNRRYYKRDEILLIRRIKHLLYVQGFTIEGARTKLDSDKKTVKTNPKSTELLKNVVVKLQSIVVELERD
jgi:DNA-binding transcriptional MerR regulator